jgi:hypothetical protein
MNARPPIITSVAQAGGGVFQLNGRGPHGAGFHLIASDDLSVPVNNWGTVTTGTMTGGAFTASDSQAPNHARRFYKIKVP